MRRDSIAIGYFDAIGSSYADLGHDRAMEALAEKYPRERPTQTKLAQLASVSQPSVNGWGEPDSYPSMPTAVKLAEKLDICVEWLLTERGPKYAQKAFRTDQDIIPLISTWSDLEDDQKRQIIRYADFIKTEK
jgi:DNA-binding XRE family transcriptional regulator